MNFNLKQVPFSRYGSYIAFSWLSEKFNNSKEQEGLYLRTVHGKTKEKDIFLIQPTIAGKPVDYNISASPEVLRLETSEGLVEFCIPEANTVRVRGTVGLRMSFNKVGSYNNGIHLQNNSWLINLFSRLIKYMVTPITGEIRVNAPWDGVDCEYVVIDLIPDNKSGVFECAVEEFESGWQPRSSWESFEDCVKVVHDEFGDFLDKMPQGPDSLCKARELAAYINWSCIVAPKGFIKRPAMFMSKNWMTNVWSWDHCFNAIALSYKYPELAWEQFMVMFDHQDESGGLPDSINDSIIIRNYYKPPIHGWALKKMMENTDYIDNAKLQEVYEPLCKWTNWWLNYRDDDCDGIPSYNHGNDSGWDNSTVFSERPPVESPELSAFLVIQMEVLSEVAQKLGKTSEVCLWKERSQILLNKLMEHSYKDGKFLVLSSSSHKVVETRSLLPYLPLILGKRLSEEVISQLVDGLKKGGFITQHGPATESPRSSFYESDGYWRGPIWAPSTMLLVDGLRASGQIELARDIAERFTKMANKSGFAENYDALTGEGLRDRAYTWTSSVFLILAHEYQYKDQC